MYRTVTFDTTFPNEWEFDETNSPVAPGARELAEALVNVLRGRASSITPIEQHEYYGWRFDVVVAKSTFFNVLNPADRCYLTVSMRWYWLKSIFGRQPRLSFERYCNLITDALREIPEVSAIEWEPYRS